MSYIEQNEILLRIFLSNYFPFQSYEKVKIAFMPYQEFWGLGCKSVNDSFCENGNWTSHKFHISVDQCCLSLALLWGEIILRSWDNAISLETTKKDIVPDSGLYRITINPFCSMDAYGINLMLFSMLFQRIQDLQLTLQEMFLG